MDVQKTMEFILESQAQHAARMDDFDSKLDALVEAQLRAEEKHDRGISEIRDELRKGVRAGIEEQRRERVRRGAFQEEMRVMALATRKIMDELAAAQLRTERKLEELIDSQKKKSNGSS